jgi:hypothetical protein
LLSVNYGFGPAGDITGDDRVNAADIDALHANLGSTDGRYDLDDDGDADRQDVDYLVETILKTAYGDATLDGCVNFYDFQELQIAFNQPGGWAQGDFDGNGRVNFYDFTLLSVNYGVGC